MRTGAISSPANKNVSYDATLIRCLIHLNGKPLGKRRHEKIKRYRHTAHTFSRLMSNVFFFINFRRFCSLAGRILVLETLYKGWIESSGNTYHQAYEQVRRLVVLMLVVPYVRSNLCPIVQICSKRKQQCQILKLCCQIGQP